VLAVVIPKKAITKQLCQFLAYCLLKMKERLMRSPVCLVSPPNAFSNHLVDFFSKKGHAFQDDLDAIILIP
jgi:hypothetical protein